jgi:hypothetical protein
MKKVPTISCHPMHNEIDCTKSDFHFLIFHRGARMNTTRTKMILLAGLLMTNITLQNCSLFHKGSEDLDSAQSLCEEKKRATDEAGKKQVANAEVYDQTRDEASGQAVLQSIRELKSAVSAEKEACKSIETACQRAKRNVALGDILVKAEIFVIRKGNPEVAVSRINQMEERITELALAEHEACNGSQN